MDGNKITNGIEKETGNFLLPILENQKVLLEANSVLHPALRSVRNSILCKSR